MTRRHLLTELDADFHAQQALLLIGTDALRELVEQARPHFDLPSFYSALLASLLKHGAPREESIALLNRFFEIASEVVD